jgi:large-conductance mechanosensitive channel
MTFFKSTYAKKYETDRIDSKIKRIRMKVAYNILSVIAMFALISFILYMLIQSVDQEARKSERQKIAKDATADVKKQQQYIKYMEKIGKDKK